MWCFVHIIQVLNKLTNLTLNCHEKSIQCRNKFHDKALNLRMFVRSLVQIIQDSDKLNFNHHKTSQWYFDHFQVNALEAFIISLFKWLPNCLFNVIWSILFWEMESTVLTAQATSSIILCLFNSEGATGTYPENVRKKIARSFIYTIQVLNKLIYPVLIATN
jgi:hypothetical protein